MKMKNKIGFSVIVTFGLLVMTGIGVNAQDWPQWRGANREGVSKEAGLNLNWSEKKPALLWTFRQAGAGYSAPVIVGTTLYGQGGADGNDFAFALDTQTGKLKWKHNLGELSVIDRGDGPRGSVTVDGDKLYLIRGGGQIHCLSAADGKMIWQKDFRSDLKGSLMSNWGYSESPLVDGNLVICTPGGGDGTMVAFDKNTGAVVWRAKEWTDQAGYSSPIVAEVNGLRQYIQQSSKGVAGVSAKDGKLLWRIENAAYRTAVIPTPVIQNNMVYVTNGYNGGCIGIQLTGNGENIKADTMYTNRIISNQHGGVVLINGYIFGFSEQPSNSWVCQNIKTGEVVWSQRGQEVGIGKGSVLGVNDRLILFDMQTGTSAVVAASPEGWKEFGKMEIPERTKISTQDNHLWTHPVVANGKLYLRDHDLLFCFDLK
jgi:outer membrane protein assembly factor BamB